MSCCKLMGRDHIKSSQVTEFISFIRTLLCISNVRNGNGEFNITLVSCEKNIVDVTKLIERGATWMSSLTPLFFNADFIVFHFHPLYEDIGREQYSSMQDKQQCSDE